MNDPEDNGAEDRFIQAKNALLAHYSSQQTSQSARLVGLAVVLLTLFQAASSRIQHLFANLVVPFGMILPSTAGWDAVRLFIFIVLVTFLIGFMLYTIGRFSVFAQLSSEVIYVTLKEAEKKTEEEKVKKQTEDKKRTEDKQQMEGDKLALHEAIHRVAWDKLKKKNPKILGGFPARLFVTTGEGDRSIMGLVCCMFLGVLPALILAWLLW